MIPALFIGVFVLVAATWLRLSFVSHRLFTTFRDRYPDEAQRRIKHAFEWRREPSKFFYFVSEESQAFLASKKDSELLANRDSVVFLFRASFAVPAIGMLLLLVTGLMWNHR